MCLHMKRLFFFINLHISAGYFDGDNEPRSPLIIRHRFGLGTWVLKVSLCGGRFRTWHSWHGFPPFGQGSSPYIHARIGRSSCVLVLKQSFSEEHCQVTFVDKISFRIGRGSIPMYVHVRERYPPTGLEAMSIEARATRWCAIWCRWWSAYQGKRTNCTESRDACFMVLFVFEQTMINDIWYHCYVYPGACCSVSL